MCNLHKYFPKTALFIVILPIVFSMWICYNKLYPMRERQGKDLKNNLKKLKKVLDKSIKMWYNKDTNREELNGKSNFKT